MSYTFLSYTTLHLPFFEISSAITQNAQSSAKKLATILRRVFYLRPANDIRSSLLLLRGRFCCQWHICHGLVLGHSLSFEIEKVMQICRCCCCCCWCWCCWRRTGNERQRTELVLCNFLCRMAALAWQDEDEQTFPACNCRFVRTIIIIAIIITTTAAATADDMHHDRVVSYQLSPASGPLSFNSSQLHSCVRKRLKIASLFVQSIKGFARRHVQRLNKYAAARKRQCLKGPTPVLVNALKPSLSISF